MLNDNSTMYTDGYNVTYKIAHIDYVKSRVYVHAHGHTAFFYPLPKDHNEKV